MSHFTMMNFQFYVDLSLRKRMALSADEAPPGRRVVVTQTIGGHDWLLPLALGDVLAIPPPVLRGEALVEHARALAAEFGADTVLAGTPDQLMETTRSLAPRKDVTLLAVGRVLTSSESRTLARFASAAVNTGVLVWGHEELWGESFIAATRERDPRAAARGAARSQPGAPVGAAEWRAEGQGNGATTV
jgi:hypothetical protein